MPGKNSNCPHCGTKKSFFNFIGQLQSKNDRRFWHIFAECENCKDVIILSYINYKGAHGDPIQASREGQFDDVYDFWRKIPEAFEPQVAEAIPENVEAPLREAELAYTSGLYSAAGSCYRKAIERSLKAIDPELIGMLNARIRKLEESGLLPHSMIELLDQVRLFGNASMHEDDVDPTKDECSAAREFCHLFLTYAFTLPSKVEEAKTQAELSTGSGET